jgi:hypothetical protein
MTSPDGRRAAAEFRVEGAYLATDPACPRPKGSLLAPRRRVLRGGGRADHPGNELLQREGLGIPGGKLTRLGEVRVERLSGERLRRHLPDLAVCASRLPRVPLPLRGLAGLRGALPAHLRGGARQRVVGAFDGERVVGAATALPLRHEPDDLTLRSSSTATRSRRSSTSASPCSCRSIAGRDRASPSSASARPRAGVAGDPLGRVLRRDPPADHPRRPAATCRSTRSGADAATSASRAWSAASLGATWTSSGDAQADAVLDEAPAMSRVFTRRRRPVPDRPPGLLAGLQGEAGPLGRERRARGRPAARVPRVRRHGAGLAVRPRGRARPRPPAGVRGRPRGGGGGPHRDLARRHGVYLLAGSQPARAATAGSTTAPASPPRKAGRATRTRS